MSANKVRDAAPDPSFCCAPLKNVVLAYGEHVTRLALTSPRVLRLCPCKITGRRFVAPLRDDTLCDGTRYNGPSKHLAARAKSIPTSDFAQDDAEERNGGVAFAGLAFSLPTRYTGAP